MKKLALLFLLSVASVFAQTANTATVGQQVTLTATANGSVPMSFQWWKNGAIWPNTTTAVVNFSSVQLYDAGSYYCVISNSAGSATTNTVTFAVTAAPVVNPPTNATATFSKK